MSAPARGFGYKPDTKDTRDRLFGAHPLSSAPVVPFATMDDDSVNPKNQQGTQSCCGQGAAQILRLSSLHAGIACPELSARFPYRAALNMDETEVDEGTQVRTVIKAIMALGACPETDMPFSEKHVLDQPSFQAERDGFDRRGLRGYYRIPDGDVEGVCRALAGGFGVVGGWQVTEAFAGADGRSVITAQHGPMAGGHCMGLVGYGPSSEWEKRYSRFRPGKSYTRLVRGIGSWGGDEVGYGYNGRFFATPEFIAQGTDYWGLDVRGDS